MVWLKHYRPRPCLLFSEYSGSNFSGGDITPISVFESFFDETLLETILFQTNLYACQANKGVNPSPLKLYELKRFIGINLLMGIKKLPSYRDYGSSITELRDPTISSAMNLHRFGWILTHLHLADNTKMPGCDADDFDKLYKLRPYFNHLLTKYKEMYAGTKVQAIDESMIAFKGRSSLKQYMPKKPIKRGYKVWVRADAYGYMCDFQIYTGKNKDTEVVEQNVGGRVVLDLCKDLNFKNYTVYFDNFFSSPNLMKDMMFKKINGCGTVRSNRKEFPKCFSADNKMKKGDYEWRSTITGITAMKWVDKKHLHLISNFHNPNELNTITRKEKDGTKKVLTCPQLIKDYNLYMGYVDKADQLKSTYEIDRKSKKWWHRIFFHFLDVTVVNSYILFSLGDETNKKKRFDAERIPTSFRCCASVSSRRLPHESSTKKSCSNSS